MPVIINKGSRERMVRMQRDLINQHAKVYGNGEGNSEKRKQILRDLSNVAKEYKGKVEDSHIEHQQRIDVKLKGDGKIGN